VRRRREKQEKKLAESNDKTLRKFSQNNLTKVNEKIDLKLLRTSFEHIPSNDSVSNSTTTSSSHLQTPKLLASLKRKRKYHQQNSSKKSSNPILNKSGNKNEMIDGLTLNPNGFSKETLNKRMIEHFDTLDKDMHFEFCVRDSRK
jgi:hypothetical protein